MKNNKDALTLRAIEKLGQLAEQLAAPHAPGDDAEEAARADAEYDPVLFSTLPIAEVLLQLRAMGVETELPDRLRTLLSTYARKADEGGTVADEGVGEAPRPQGSEDLLAPPIMTIGSIRTLSGPNVYSHRPVVLMRLSLGELAGRESHEVPGFIERLLTLLPGLRDHHCSKGRPGGFVQRLHEGTFFGHVVEHVALELTTLAGVPTTHGKTREAGEPGTYNIVVEYKAEHGTRFLLRAAVALVEALVCAREFPLHERLGEARRLIGRTELGPTTRAIVEAAERHGVPWSRVGDDNLVQLGYGKHRRFIQAAASELTSLVAAEVAADKNLTKLLLNQAAIPVPRGRVVRTEGEALAALAELGAPVVVKPLDGRQGLGVSLNLSTPDEVVRAFRLAHDFSPQVLVEELLRGRNYRVLVVNRRAVAAVERLACHVTGDGARTVAELIEAENRSPLRGEGHGKPLTKIHVDEIVLAHLRETGLSLSHVPARGEVVTLRAGINLSTGGTARDVTEEVHPSVNELCERAARVVGLDICGVDLVLKDISAPFGRGSGGVIELNASPGLRMHLFPSEGQPRNVGGRILEMFFPDGDGRVPLVSVTGTNGKTTVTRMIAHVLADGGATVGMTTTDGIYIGGSRVAEGDTTGPHSARTVLGDPAVEAAVLETARGGLLRRGLGYDWSDVAVLTNIQPDHIGQDGIETLEDIVFIKSLVAERVREGGTLVLNADDESLARLMEVPRLRKNEKQVVYFSLYENHLLIRGHLAAGGTAYFVRDGWVVEARGQSSRVRLLDIAELPVTMRGTAQFQVGNVLACVAACRAQGVGLQQLAAALSTFQSASHNPGRATLYRLPFGGHVLLDYARNPSAFLAVSSMISRWAFDRVTGIIGMPGNRSDGLITWAGRVAARTFRRIIIREDSDLRGRRSGEVADLLARAVAEEAPGGQCRVVLDEESAFEQELRGLGDGELLVMFYERLELPLRLLSDYGAAPVTDLSELAGAASAAAESASMQLGFALHTYAGRREVAVGAQRVNPRHDGYSNIWR